MAVRFTGGSNSQDRTHWSHIQIFNKRVKGGVMSDYDYSYDNPRDLLRFIMDVSLTNSKADYNDDKIWKSEFQFIVTEIDEFLKG